MNLCVDIGNTRTKIAIFDNEGSILKLIVKDEFIASKLDKLFNKYSIRNVIISSVKKKQGKFRRLFGSKLAHFIELSASTPIPIKNLYTTPETLGKDRLAGVIGAASIFPNSDILVIDAGTCITYDIIDAQGKYYGGNILPGLNMRFRALHSFTDRLPMLHREPLETHVGDSTASSIQTGVQYGIVYEMKGFINKYKDIYPDLRVLITGGDASFFVSQMENQIFAVPDLVLMGLNHILNYNIQLSDKEKK